MSDESQEKPRGTFSRLMSGANQRPDKDAEEPTKERTSEPTHERPNVRTSNRQHEETQPSEAIYRIVVPRKRQRVRWAFDIFHDQKTAIDILQFAALQQGDKKPTVAAIVQNAIDAFIKREAKRLPNVVVEIEDSPENT
jgi:hypothetical protein